MPGQAKNHVVGPATDSEGTRTTAYRAVAEFVCAQCGGRIIADLLFSRGAQQGYRNGTFGVGLAMAPICMTCRPLRVDEAADTPAPPDGERHGG